MRKAIAVCSWALVLAVCFAGSAMAQQQPAEVSRIYYVTPKTGMEMQFEEAVKKHAAWHGQRNDPWQWVVRFNDTGNHTGEYLFISPGHQWKDFDNPPIPMRDDDAHFNTTVQQYVASWSSAILVTRRDLTRSPSTAPAASPSVVTYFHLRYGQTAKFVDAQRQIREALEKTNAPGQEIWYQMYASGRNATFVLALARENWAAFEGTGGPSLRARVEQTFGAARADAIFRALEESVAFTESKITVARPDLSYTPAPR
jgi:hypothetical protein